MLKISFQKFDVNSYYAHASHYLIIEADESFIDKLFDDVFDKHVITASSGAKGFGPAMKKVIVSPFDLMSQSKNHSDETTAEALLKFVNLWKRPKRVQISDIDYRILCYWAFEVKKIKNGKSVRSTLPKYDQFITDQSHLRKLFDYSKKNNIDPKEEAVFFFIENRLKERRKFKTLGKSSDFGMYIPLELFSIFIDDFTENKKKTIAIATLFSQAKRSENNWKNSCPLEVFLMNSCQAYLVI